MLIRDYYSEYIDDLGNEALKNAMIKEALETAAEEIEYFFRGKERLAEIFAEGMDFSKLNEWSLKERFHKVFYSPKELKIFLQRVEKRIGREFEKAGLAEKFTLGDGAERLADLEGCFSCMQEEVRTFRLSNTASKAINLAWKKTTCGVVPKSVNRLGCHFNIGQHFLSSMGLSPKEVVNNICKKMTGRIKGILKQHRVDVTAFIKNEIVSHVINADSSICLGRPKLKEIKTA